MRRRFVMEIALLAALGAVAASPAPAGVIGTVVAIQGHAVAVGDDGTYG